LRAEETPLAVCAVPIRDSIVEMCLANEGRVIADMTFSNRAEVEDLKHAMSTAFASAEEIAADSIDQVTTAWIR
jgi:hypothetical protein